MQPAALCYCVSQRHGAETKQDCMETRCGRRFESTGGKGAQVWVAVDARGRREHRQAEGGAKEGRRK